MTLRLIFQISLIVSCLNLTLQETIPTTQGPPSTHESATHLTDTSSANNSTESNDGNSTSVTNKDPGTGPKTIPPSHVTTTEPSLGIKLTEMQPQETITTDSFNNQTTEPSEEILQEPIGEDFVALVTREALCEGVEDDVKVYRPVPFERTWFQGNIFCDNLDLQLVTIESEEEQHTINELLFKYKGQVPTNEVEAEGYRKRGENGPKTYWTGGTRIGKTYSTTDFYWYSSNEPYFNYTNWGKSEDLVPQPDNAQRREKCVYLVATNTTASPLGTWHDGWCYSERPFICQVTCGPVKSEDSDEDVEEGGEDDAGDDEGDKGGVEGGEEGGAGGEGGGGEGFWVVTTEGSIQTTMGDTVRSTVGGTAGTTVEGTGETTFGGTGSITVGGIGGTTFEGTGKTIVEETGGTTVGDTGEAIVEGTGGTTVPPVPQRGGTTVGVVADTTQGASL